MAEAVGQGTLVVTGGGRGIGAAVARLAAGRGWDVALGYRADRAAAEAVAAEVRAAGARAVAVAGEAADEGAVTRLFEAAAALGPVRGLVTAAGITGGFARVEALDPALLRRVLEVNVVGTLLACREAVRRLSTRRGGPGGAIVTVSSIAARLGSPGEYVHYAASKGAVESLTVGLAREVAEEGIRVNAVAPGIIETGIHAAGGDPGRPQRLAPGIPLKRPGQPGEVAEAVLWLLSPAASYVTGAVLDAGGGR